jgi:phosphonate transport system substrate-binding protein
MKLFALLAALLLVPVPASTTASAGAGSPTKAPLELRFGVYQSDKATEMYKRFTPFLEALQEDTGKRLGVPCSIDLSIYKSYDDAIEALVAGTVDFVHFGPASYITAKERNADIELLGMEHENGEKSSKGIIIVKKDSPIQTIEDLRGKSFAFGDKNSTIGRYLVQAELVAHGVYANDLSFFRYLDRHDQVASAVEHGDFDAGSVKFTSFKKANERNTLRVLATFDNVTKPVVVRAGMDRAVFTALQESLFAFKNDAFFKEMKISGFTNASESDFKLVREGMKQANKFENPHRGD